MFLRAGGDTAIVTEDIVGIFDIEANTTPEATKKLLRESERRGETLAAFDDVPKSFVLTSDGGYNSRIVLSDISSKRLAGRITDSVLALVPQRAVYFKK